MKIGVLGSGDVGKTLAAGFSKHGHSVMIGTRDTAKLTDWKGEHAGAQVGDFAQTAAFGEVLVLAVHGSAAIDVMTMAGTANTTGKVVMDTSNPIGGAPENGVLKFFTTLEDSLMERLQKAFPDVRFVKAFNSVGNSRMVDPDFDGVKPTMFICGNDEAAKKKATEVLDQFGWETADMGKVEAARAIEPLCILWCIPGFLRNEWMHAFKLLK
jgi:hypothetical protein